jgi:hypothetical protein
VNGEGVRNEEGVVRGVRNKWCVEENDGIIK